MYANYIIYSEMNNITNQLSNGWRSIHVTIPGAHISWSNNDALIRHCPAYSVTGNCAVITPRYCV